MAGMGVGPGVYGMYATSAASYSLYADSSAQTSGSYAAVYGTIASPSGAGIEGINTATTGGAGVYGKSDGAGYGGQFVGLGSAFGVYASSASGYGIWGASTNTDGVVGEDSSNGNGVYGSSGGTGAGVRGYSVSGDGVYGLGNASGQAGVYGTTQSPSGGFGVYGLASGTGSFGVYGSAGSSSGGIGVTGIGTGTGTLAGFFNGAVTVLGTLSVSSCTGCTTTPSDIRLKKDVKPLEGALDQLLQLHAKTYGWIAPEEHENDASTVRGFIAQDVQKVFPSWVKEEAFTAPDGKKYKTLDLRQIEALEVESIRTLNDKNKALEAQVKNLTDHLQNLENGAHPIAASFTSGLGISPGNLGLAVLTMFGAYAVSRKKRDEKQS